MHRKAQIRFKPQKPLKMPISELFKGFNLDFIQEITYPSEPQPQLQNPHSSSQDPRRSRNERTS